MAKKNENIELIKVKALVHLKYNREYVEIGHEFEINEDDLKEMLDKELVLSLEEINEDKEQTVEKEGE